MKNKPLTDINNSDLDSSSSWLGDELRAIGYNETPRKVINDHNAWGSTVQEFLDSLDIFDHTQDERFAGTFKSWLQKSRPYQVLIATLGTNGNGGQFADPDDLEAEFSSQLDEFEPVAFRLSELLRHWKDADAVGSGDPNNITAWELHEADEDGYLTGRIVRVYFEI